MGLLSYLLRKEEHPSERNLLALSAYFWKCVSYKSLDLSAFAIFPAQVIQGPAKIERAPCFRNVAQQWFLKRMERHWPEISKCAEAVMDLGPNETPCAYWWNGKVPNLLSPVHLCAQALTEEVPFLQEHVTHLVSETKLLTN